MQVGPLLYMRGLRGGRLDLTALVVRPASQPMPELATADGAVAGSMIGERCGSRVFHYPLSLPARPDAAYRLDGERFNVNAAFEGDLRIAYVSCNGQEHGDRTRAPAERNALWQRLAAEHAERPFNLLLHGGDQMYADEILDTHPSLRRRARRRRTAAGDADAGAVAAPLRDAFFERYLGLYRHPPFAWLAARVPSLAMWDDHDICDGWGSLPPARMDSTIGRAVFAAAREHFLLFQLGAPPTALPELCTDASGTSLTWHLRLPRLHVIAPDLRSERRPTRVMGRHGWEALRRAADAARGGQVLVLSSVPALGPRLSWIEALLRLTPAMQKHEDDLRDQWQSRAHRAEWRAFLRQLIEIHARPGARVTVLSGEIHLATRATLATPHRPVQQLVASGIAHPPPPALYARALGALARLGESPLPGHPIRLHPLPGRSAIYTAQRNYLVLERLDEAWRARWELEADGPTPFLALG